MRRPVRRGARSVNSQGDGSQQPMHYNVRCRRSPLQADRVDACIASVEEKSFPDGGHVPSNDLYMLICTKTSDRDRPKPQ